MVPRSSINQNQIKNNINENLRKKFEKNFRL